MTVVRARLISNGTWRGEPLPGPQRGGLSPAIAIVMMCVSLSVVCDRLITNGTWERRTPSGPAARGPVPRDRPICAKTARQPRPFPRPRHGEGQALALRAAAHFFRSAGPSDAIRASERVSPASVGVRRRWRGTGFPAALLHRDQEVSPTGETEAFGVSRNHSNRASAN